MIPALFDDLPKRARKTTSKQGPPQTPQIPREAKNLEHQLNQHLRSKYKADTRVSLATPHQLPIDDLIDKDIARRKAKNRTWNSMNACDKWSLVKEYYKATNEPFNERLTKQLLLSKQLDVTYDVDAACIKSISIPV